MSIKNNKHGRMIQFWAVEVDANWPSATLPVPASASFPDCVHLKSICILFTARFPSSGRGRRLLSLQPSVAERWEQGGERCFSRALVHAPFRYLWRSNVLSEAAWDWGRNRGWQLAASTRAFIFLFHYFIKYLILIILSNNGMCIFYSSTCRHTCRVISQCNSGPFIVNNYSMSCCGNKNRSAASATKVRNV